MLLNILINFVEFIVYLLVGSVVFVTLIALIVSLIGWLYDHSSLTW